MNYVELDIEVDPLLPFREILVAILSERGFESFVNTSNGLSAFVQEKEYLKLDVPSILNEVSGCKVEWSMRVIPHANWNDEWEKNYEPVVVNDSCVIRALFHDPMPNYQFEIIIQPQMSFGTGHHPTTLLMMEVLFRHDLEGKSLMDIGTGTGVLSILAEKKGALNIVATDIEDHIISNAKDNVRHNDCVNIRVDKADIGLS
ncbi:MAG: 50S ribosomal protein L11 methyltransferase, partial [Flavobacteriales bacterium]|nr:50S ribosomal protein L11 methyltransferase [Flavobacteriales bacterium]